MATEKSKLDIIAMYRRFIEFGFDSGPDFLEYLSSRVAKGTLKRDFLADILDSVPVGEGHPYRDVCASILGYSFSEFIDTELLKVEQGSRGGNADIEMPISIESLQPYPLILEWCRRYTAKSILVEVKNQKGKATVGDVGQLHSYFDPGRFGSLGIIISRNGFTSRAMKSIRDRVNRDECLIIPFDHQDVLAIASSRQSGIFSVMKDLRRRETVLRQAG